MLSSLKTPKASPLGCPPPPQKKAKWDQPPITRIINLNLDQYSELDTSIKPPNNS